MSNFTPKEKELHHELLESADTLFCFLQDADTEDIDWPEESVEVYFDEIASYIEKSGEILNELRNRHEKRIKRKINKFKNHEQEE